MAKTCYASNVFAQHQANLSLAPALHGTAMSKSFEHVKQAANDQFRQGSYQEALKGYTDAIALCQRSAESAATLATLHSNRSAAKLHLEDYPGAYEDAKNANSLDPFPVKYAYRMALALKHMGGQQHLKEACQILDRAVDQDLANVEVRGLQQEVYKMLGRSAPLPSSVLKPAPPDTVSSLADAASKCGLKLAGASAIDPVAFARWMGEAAAFAEGPATTWTHSFTPPPVPPPSKPAPASTTSTSTATKPSATPKPPATTTTRSSSQPAKQTTAAPPHHPKGTPLPSFAQHALTRFKSLEYRFLISFSRQRKALWLLNSSNFERNHHCTYGDFAFTLAGAKPCALWSHPCDTEYAPDIVRQVVQPVFDEFKLASHGFLLHRIKNRLMTDDLGNPGFRFGWVLVNSRHVEYSFVRSVFMQPHRQRVPEESIGRALGYPVSMGDEAGEIRYGDETECNEQGVPVVLLRYFCNAYPSMEEAKKILSHHDMYGEAFSALGRQLVLDVRACPGIFSPDR